MSLAPPSLTLGIEEEYLLVDRRTRDLVTSAPEGMLEELERRLQRQVNPEFLQSQVEIGTRVCRHVGEAREDLTRLRTTVAEVVAEHGLAPIAASTHPFASWRQQKHVEKERYILLARDMQALAHRLVICGMHVHVGIEDDNLRIDLMNQVAYFLPHLLVLSTSSPFWMGMDTGLKSYRPTIFGDLPRTGLPEQFESWGEYQRMVDTMIAAGVLDEPTKIWWDVRPAHRFPTLEMRIADICTRMEDALTIAAIYQSLLSMLYRLRRHNQRWRIYRAILVNENKWRAQRYGIHGELVDYGEGRTKPYSVLLEEIINYVRDEADRLNCLAEVERAREIVARGTSADQQLAVYRSAREAGADDMEALRAVVDWLIEETVAGLAPGPEAPHIRGETGAAPVGRERRPRRAAPQGA